MEKLRAPSWLTLKKPSSCHFCMRPISAQNLTPSRLNPAAGCTECWPRPGALLRPEIAPQANKCRSYKCSLHTSFRHIPCQVKLWVMSCTSGQCSWSFLSRTNSGFIVCPEIDAAVSQRRTSDNTCCSAELICSTPYTNTMAMLKLSWLGSPQLKIGSSFNCEIITYRWHCLGPNKNTQNALQFNLRIRHRCGFVSLC